MENITDNKLHLAKFEKVVKIAEDTYEMSFVLEKPMDYEPGQYVWVQIPEMKYQDAKGDRRAMSLASIPSQVSEISIIFRNTKSGFKKSALELKKGDEVNILGPHGQTFVLPSKSTTPLVLISGGVGIAPFLSITRQAVNAKLKIPITLINLNESDKKTIYQEEVKSLNVKNSDIKGISKIGKLAWEDISKIDGLKDATIYIAGSQGFVNFVHDLLVQNEIYEHQLKYENFYPINSEIEKFQNYFDIKLDKEKQLGLTNLSDTQGEIMLEALESSAQHTIITDINGMIVFANTAAENITGYKFAEMRGQTPRLWGGIMPKEFNQNLWQSKDKGEVIEGELVNRRKNHSLYNVSAHISPIKDENGSIVGWIGSEEDITPLKQRETELQNLSDRFVLATGSAHIGVWDWDIVNDKLEIDEEMYKIYGIKKEDFHGSINDWQARLNKEDIEKANDALQSAITGKSNFDIIFRIDWPDKSIHYIKAIGIVKFDEQGKAQKMIGVNWDVTHEQEVDKAKTEFVSLASHQLRTPLTAIKWYAEMLSDEKKSKLTDTQRKYLKQVTDGNERMIELVNDLLNVSRLDLGTFSVEPKMIDIVQLAQSIVSDLGPLIHTKQIKLTQDYAKDIPKVNTDPTLMRVVVENILSNSIKYTPQKGKVDIAIKKDKQNFMISIKDSGMGIPKNQHDKIFTKLFRADNATSSAAEGTGLGLYMVKGIVDNAGGKIWFESQENKGTTFFVEMPLKGMQKKEGGKKIEQST